MQRWLRFGLASIFASGCAMKPTGVVRDARTGQPIGGARVHWDDRIAYTDPVGVYRLKVHRVEQATVYVEAAGYAPAHVACVTPERRPVCDVTLEAVR